MTLPSNSAHEALVRKRLTEMLEVCRQTNTRPSVLKLAQSVGLSNTTFRRRYPEIVREIAGLRTPSHEAPTTGPSTIDKLTARNAKIRRRNHALTRQLALAVAQIQYLALRNQQLQEQLEGQTQVTHITTRPRR